MQDVNHAEASCVFQVKVGMLDRLGQSNICILTVTTLSMARLTIQHYMNFSVCFPYDPRHTLRQTSADILSVEACSVYVSHT
jgi:hypothetical protein